MSKDKKKDRKMNEQSGAVDSNDKPDVNDGLLPDGAKDAESKDVEPKPKFGALYKAAVAIQDEISGLNERMKDAKKRLSGALEVLVKHHGSGPWKIEGQSISVTSRGGGHYFRGVGKAQEVDLED